MKIVKVEHFHVDGGWDPWSFLKLTTDDGLIGWSEYSEARARRGLIALVREMSELLIGEDPTEFARISAKLKMLTKSAAGGLQSLAIGAFENAYLDIAGKALGVPVYKLFGGALRKRLPVYWSHCGMYRARYPKLFPAVTGDPPVVTLDDIRTLGAEVRTRGFRALKTNLLALAPGLIGTGPPFVQRGKDEFAYNIDEQLIGMVVDQMTAFREGAGPDVGLMLDLNFNYKTEGYRRIAKALEPLKLTWLEIDTYDAQALRTIRESTSTPIASLEALLGIGSLKPYLECGAVDVGIIDAVFNGLHESVRMATLFEAYEINAAVHNSHGPLGSLISAQFGAIVPNFRILELDVDAVPWRKELLTHPETIEAGEYVLSDRPGWGADLDEAVALAHPLKR
jgi:L-alanine-DL-glutamate epimerase-like enolase superfamily enzyme